jgi:hypothetical protein
MYAKTMFDPSTPLAAATVQDIHLELIRRSEHNAFHGERVLADLLVHRQDWQAVLFDTYGLATDRGLPARLPRNFPVRAGFREEGEGHVGRGGHRWRATVNAW